MVKQFCFKQNIGTRFKTKVSGFKVSSTMPELVSDPLAENKEIINLSREETIMLHAGSHSNLKDALIRVQEN